MVKSTKCDVYRGGTWEPIDIEEALSIRGEYDMRCPACHGRVQAHKQATNGMRAHFEHLVAHKGCGLFAKFSAKVSLHPEALD